MKFSQFGEKFTNISGILELMDDLGHALRSADPEKPVYMLGGGNPAHIEPILDIFQHRIQHLANSRSSIKKLIANYDPPQGDPELMINLANFFQHNYGWNISERNIAISSGSQSAFFFLFNLFAGKFNGESIKKIFLPIIPEYIGYSDLGLLDKHFEAIKPRFEETEEHKFKYRIDFDNFPTMDEIGGISISRPSNPTGNVITDKEILQLHQISKNIDIPLIIDNAYGFPFPNVLFKDIEPFWDDTIIHTFSFSKFGLPGTRTGVIVASEEIIEALARINAIIHLSNSNLGSSLMLPLIQDSSVIKISNTIIKPFYQRKSELAQKILFENMPKEANWNLHESEGAFFLWLCVKNLQISNYELYNRLKQHRVFIVPGNYFFPGFDQSWKHKDECIRITFAQDDQIVETGLKIICSEIKKNV